MKFRQFYPGCLSHASYYLGSRRRYAAENGYVNVWSMDGGWTAWQEAGAPVE